MKFTPGIKKERRAEWFAVMAPPPGRRKRARDWCKAHPSPGKFYYHYTNTRWWFEYRTDAAHFVLMWGEL